LHHHKTGIDHGKGNEKMGASLKEQESHVETPVAEKRIVVEAMGLSGYVMFGPTIREPQSSESPQRAEQDKPAESKKAS
jgi:hypothetical protein